MKNLNKKTTLNAYITDHIGNTSVEQLTKLVDGVASPAKLNIRANSKLQQSD